MSPPAAPAPALAPTAAPLAPATAAAPVALVAAPASPPLYVPLRVHTAYSLAEGAIRIKPLMEAARSQAMPAIAITDSGNLFGALDFAMAARDAGIQPIIGLELPIALPPALSGGPVPHPDPTRPYDRDRLVLLAQDQLGYRGLMALSSAAFLETPATETLHVPLERLAAHSQGVLCLTGGVDGPVVSLLAAGRADRARALLEQLAALFPGRLYVEVTRTGRVPEAGTEAALIALADALDLPLVATNPAYFLKAETAEAHDALMCIAATRYLFQEDRPKVSPQQYLKTPAEMAQLFADLPDAIANTAVIAQRCHLLLKAVDPILPRFPTGAGRSEGEELALQAGQGLERRLAAKRSAGAWPTQESPEAAAAREAPYRERLAYELSVIGRMGFDGYFLIVADFIQWAKSQGIPVGPGRGSGAASVVAWSLTITDLDPLQFDLLFERFLNPERVSMPDFDIDFCEERRKEVIAYTRAKYGSDRLAQIITFGKLQARAVLRDVGRVMQMPYGQVDRLCKLVPNNPTRPVTLQQAIDGEAELRAEAARDETVARLFQVATQLEGLYRNASTHAAGVVIGDRPLTELVALYRDPKSTIPATQFNMKYVELAGLVKFDFLGLKTLTVLQEAVRLVAQTTGTQLDLAHLPLDDARTYQMLSRGESAGVFQLESSGMKDVLRRLKPDRFEDIVALVALYRPGPMDNIPRYIAIKDGREQPDYLHPLLEPVLKETFGIMIYQEQVMQVAQILAGYSLGAADLLRRAMGKKNAEAMAAERARFTDGARANGLEAEHATRIFDTMAKFADYGFNKAHAAAYALLAYQTGWLKANHPVAFMAATMTFELDNTDKLAFFRQEVDRLGIRLLGPDINRSAVRFAVEQGDQGREQQRDQGAAAIRYALGALKGVGTAAMALVVQERERGGPFRSIADFASRAPSGALNRKTVETLVRAGAFDVLEPNRRRLFEAADQIVRHAQLAAEERASAQASLFGSAADSRGGDAAAAAQGGLRLGDVADWALAQRLEEERAAIGFFLSAHPLDAYRPELARLKVTPILDVVTGRMGSALIAGIVNARSERVNARGNRMAFVSLSDSSGALEATVFSELLAVHRPLLEPGRAIVMRIEIARSDGEGDGRVTAQQIDDLEERVANAITGADLRIRDPRALEQAIAALQQAEPGRVALTATLPLEDGRRAVLALPRRIRIDTRLRTALAAIEGLELALGAAGDGPGRAA